MTKKEREKTIAKMEAEMKEAKSVRLRACKLN